MNASTTCSPHIEHIDWGEMTVAGLGTGKDFTNPNTGTRHVPGIQPDDVEELLAAGAETIILSRGMWQALHTQQATLDRLEQADATVHVLETREAVEKYNQLAAAGEPVAGLFHSTC